MPALPVVTQGAGRFFMAIKHKFTSAKDDGGDATLVRPSNWNDDHEGLETVLKSADESVNNSETLQNDDELLLAIGANEKWEVTFYILAISATTTPDLRVAITAPSGATGAISLFYDVGTDGELLGGTVTGIALVASLRLIVISAVVVNSSNAGNIQLQWAQSTATAENTTVKAGSCLIAHKLN